MLVDDYLCSICLSIPASRMCDFILPGGNTRKVPLCQEDSCLTTFYFMMRALIEQNVTQDVTGRYEFAAGVLQAVAQCGSS